MLPHLCTSRRASATRTPGMSSESCAGARVSVGAAAACVRRSGTSGGASSSAAWVRCRAPRVSTLRGHRAHATSCRGVGDSDASGSTFDNAHASSGTSGANRVSIAASTSESERVGGGSSDTTKKSSSWQDAPPAPLALTPNQLPNHIAIIMDGNARWALENNLPTNAGHERGVEALRRVIQVCAEWNINVITVYAFSHENWRRQKDEVSYLMELFEKTLTDELPDLIEQDIRVSVMGDLGMVSDDLRAAIKQTTEKTKYNKKMKLNVALSYGARQDLVAATRSLALDCAAGLIASEDITEQMIAERLSSNFGGSVYGQTDSGADSASPDLLIRTSGEQRLSNFMLWECAYTEFYFTETLWPEFGEEALRHALETYASRQRRFGVRSGGE